MNWTQWKRLLSALGVVFAIGALIGTLQVFAKEQDTAKAEEKTDAQPADEKEEGEEVEEGEKVDEDAEDILELPDDPAEVENYIQQWMEARQRKLEKRLREDPAWKASHEEAAVIKAGDDLKPGAVQNFCLDRDGNLLIGCSGAGIEYVQGSTPGAFEVKTIEEPAEIRVISPEGKRLKTWKIDVKPEAICVHRDGTIFVGGDGRLAKLDSGGKLLATVRSPALPEPKPEPPGKAEEAESEEADPKEDAKEKETTKKESKSLFQAMIEAILGEKSEEKKAREAAMAKAMERRKRNVTGIAVSDRDLFVACPASKGYGYAVYRLDHELKNPVKIVDRLRGCCGQMDIQTKDGELWVAENARHRVTRYDRDGKELSHFGKRDRKQADCFGGCCEPKNLRFGPGGEVYAAESGPPVAVKRFSPKGEFLGVVGLPKFKTGCVRVTVAISADGRRVYVLNTSENAICVLEDKRCRPTHKQVATISVAHGEKPAELHTFCLDKDDNLLVACGGKRVSYVKGSAGREMKMIDEPAEIRVLSPEGDPLRVFSLDFKPSALNIGEDGMIYVGGNGRLAKLDSGGKVLVAVDAPQVAELGPLPPLPEKTEEDEVQRKARQEKAAELEPLHREAMKAFQEAQKELVAAEDDEARKAAEAWKAAKAKSEKAMAEIIDLGKQLRETRMTPETLAMHQRAAAMRKQAVTGIAVTGKDVFVAVPEVKGYGYAVWRMDRDLRNPEKIVDRLRGCCSQMDIQAHDGILYVAENGRARVVRYYRDGKQLSHFGKRDRKGIEGFGSCCNPMNIRFGPGGELYTSEAGLGRIKRYSPEGELLGLVAKAELVPGCKHVAIGVSKDGNRVYMLDITRHHIVVMQRRQPADADTSTEETSTGEST